MPLIRAGDTEPVMPSSDTRLDNSQPLLELRNVALGFAGETGVVPVVREVSFALDAGQTLALVGESGSGKSVTALSILRLLDSPPLALLGGQVLWQGEDLLTATEPRLRQIRGHEIGVIFQEPLTALNPLHPIHRQISEVIERHQGLSRQACMDLALEWLERVGIRDPREKLSAYPHQLSGGERQRVMIAMALVNRPKLLIADEPTTALDVTIQAQVLKLIKALQVELGMAVLFITHDLHIVRQFADTVAVMEKGRLVEQGATPEVFSRPAHPYTQKLLAAEPHGQPPAFAEDAEALLKVEDLRCWFPVKRGLLRRVTGHVKAVDGISLDIRPGEAVGVVGESGSGKSTLGKAVLRLQSSEGTILFRDLRLDQLSPGALKPLRREIQVIFQDPFGALSPRMTILEIIREGLDIHDIGNREDRESQVIDAMRAVDLDPDWRFRYPNEFSGGQRQRICIARALVLKPRLLILDEPTSSLDRTVQQQVIELLQKLQQDHGLSYLFISHDLRVVRALCHRIIVMQAGRVVEAGPSEQVYTQPRQAYTQELLRTAMLLEA